MKSIIVILFSIIFLTACNSKNNVTNNSKTDSSAIKAKLKELNQLKDISELKMSFIDGPEPKVIDILGKPDKRGEFGNRENGYLIYYDLTKDNNQIKTLIISYTNAQVDDVVSANNYETVSLPDGAVTINKPLYFNSIYHNIDTTLSQIDKLLIDTTKIPCTQFYNDGHEIKGYRYKDSGKIGLIKVVFPIESGNFAIICYYFDYSSRLMCKIESDKIGNLITDKSYVVNDRVVKYLQGKDVTPCKGTCEPSFDEFSQPYTLLKRFPEKQ